MLGVANIVSTVSSVSIAGLSTPTMYVVELAVSSHPRMHVVRQLQELCPGDGRQHSRRHTLGTEVHVSKHRHQLIFRNTGIWC
jgi:hypothetical protein